MAEVGQQYGLPAVSAAKVSAIADAGLQALQYLVDAGVKIGFGTDLLGETHGRQNREFLIRARVQKPIDVLRSATSVNAELLGMKDELGVIAPGALADLIVSDGDPLRDLTPLADDGRGIRMVMRDGAITRNDL